MYKHIAKLVQLGSNSDQFYIQNGVVMNRVIKRSRCRLILVSISNPIMFNFRWSAGDRFPVCGAAPGPGQGPLAGDRVL